MNICMVGVGYVGLVTGACFAEFGINVVCVDRVQEKIDMLKQGKVPIYEPGLEEMVSKNAREGRLSFTTDLEEGIKNSLVIFIAVGTPQGNDGAADLKYVEQVAKSIGQSMTDYKVVVTKSTVPVGTGQKVAAIIKANQSSSIDFDVVSNPEFLREGSAIEDFMRPNRVVVGTESERAQAVMRDLYAPLYLIETPFVVTNVETAEMIKYASNAFLATKISFINEMANICEKVEADVNQVAKGMGLDQRIGPKFLHAGPGYGGSCFPKDTEAIAHIAKDCDYRFRIVEAVIEVNRTQRLRMAEKIAQSMGDKLEGKVVACLGLTFKPNTDDMRESPSLAILPAIMKQGAKVRAYDPAGMAEAMEKMPGLVACDNAYHAAEDADCLVIMTDWNQFRNLDWARLRGVMSGKVVVDLRNAYNPGHVRSKGFSYYSVGRLTKSLKSRVRS